MVIEDLLKEKHVRVLRIMLSFMRKGLIHLEDSKMMSKSKERNRMWYWD
ncbi:MAG: hypothetical protein CM15mP12_1320 [Gammaproteobacteria bacterium]|nr:MAG: hypothetical protein CM15mP12_1320 [Gammaproteobacteria bacterium]